MPRVTISRLPTDLMLLPVKTDPACKNSERKLRVGKFAWEEKGLFSQWKPVKEFKRSAFARSNYLFVKNQYNSAVESIQLRKVVMKLKHIGGAKNHSQRKIAWWKAFISHSRVRQIILAQQFHAEEPFVIVEGTLSAWNIHVLYWISDSGLIYRRKLP